MAELIDTETDLVLRRVSIIIGASVSEPLSSDLNVNFVCLSVMDGPSTYCKSHPALILHVLRHVLIQNHSRVEDMNHGQSNSSMAITRTETTHGLTYSAARVIDITTWQSVGTVCLSCLTHGVCVSHWTPTSSHNSVMEMARVLSSVHNSCLQLSSGFELTHDAKHAK